MILDVGCGNMPRGDVNVDLYINEDFHRDARGRILTERISIFIFIRADALYLPFRDKVFEKSLSSHTIEHTDNPILFLQELLRVGKELELRAPFGCVNDWLWWRVHGYKWHLFPSWYREQGLHPEMRIVLKTVKVRRKKIPFFRYPYVEVRVTN